MSDLTPINAQGVLPPLPMDTSGVLITPSRFANNFAVQWTEFEITILFFDVKVPLNPFTDPDHIAAYNSAMNIMPAECVSRIVVTTERVPELISLLTQAVDASKTLRDQRK